MQLGNQGRFLLTYHYEDKPSKWNVIDISLHFAPSPPRPSPFMQESLKPNQPLVRRTTHPKICIMMLTGNDANMTRVPAINLLRKIIKIL